MTPTNEQVVAACQRAGISVYASQFYDGLIVTSKSNEGYPIYPSDDNYPGSALFIVAVLGALRFEQITRSVDGSLWFISLLYCSTLENTVGGSTLTAACMAAIVAAHPEEEARKG